MKTKTPEPEIRPLAPLLLLAASAAECLLSLFQWMELLVVRAGGHTICSVNDVVNCEQVWSSSFASRLHHLTQLPVAGLGLLWGLVAFSLSAVLVQRLLARKDARVAVAAVRVAGAAGVLSCVTFGVASLNLGALCLTCLGTYALVLGFALVAARGLPGPLMAARADQQRALLWAAGFAVLFYLVLLGPGMSTPSLEQRSLTQQLEGPTDHPRPADQQAAAELERFLSSLPMEEQQQVSQSLAIYRHSPTPPAGAFPTRLRVGPADAPVKIVDFTDVRCPHCRHLEETLQELRRAVPEGSFSVEPRAFPLDGECNRFIPTTDGTHVRCTGAKALICLEGRPEYWQVREKLFEEQDSLTPERVVQIATSGGMARPELEACLDSPPTLDKLSQDENYALQYQPQGTPLVLVNGREATAVPAFLYAMALTGGNPDAPAFAKLAAPQLPVGP